MMRNSENTRFRDETRTALRGSFASERCVLVVRALPPPPLRHLASPFPFSFFFSLLFSFPLCVWDHCRTPSMASRRVLSAAVRRPLLSSLSTSCRPTLARRVLHWQSQAASPARLSPASLYRSSSSTASPASSLKGSGIVGIRRETKNRWERRAPLVPGHVRTLRRRGIRVLVQPSTMRSVSDERAREEDASKRTRLVKERHMGQRASDCEHRHTRT